MVVGMRLSRHRLADRPRTGVLASSLILEAVGFDSLLGRPSGLNLSKHLAAPMSSSVRFRSLEPRLPACLLTC